MAVGLLKVSAVAKRASLPARTVRFYADSGLLKPAALQVAERSDCTLIRSCPWGKR